MDRAVNMAIAVLAFAGAAAFASCSGDGGATGAGAAAGAGDSGAGGRAASAGAAPGRGGSGPAQGGVGSFPGVVPFDPNWMKTTPADWILYPISATACDGCANVNPDGVERLVDSVRAQRADGQWSVFGSRVANGVADKAPWAIDIRSRHYLRLDDGCGLTRDDGSRCIGAIPSVDAGYVVFANDRETVQGVLITRLESGETKRLWESALTRDPGGIVNGPFLLATGMAYPYAFWVEAGIYRLDLRDGTVARSGACDVIEAVTVARNGLACCDGYGQGAVVIDFDHDTIERYPAGFSDPNRIGIHSYLSKDGTELVWAEHPAGGRETDSYRIVYRNLVSGNERVLAQNDDPTVKRNDYPVVEGGVVFWERELVAPAVPGFRTTGLWKVGDVKMTVWDRHVGQFRPTPYGLVGTGFPGTEVIVPAPNLLFPYPDGFRPATLPAPTDGE